MPSTHDALPTAERPLKPSLAVFAVTDAVYAKAAAIAERLKLPLLTEQHLENTPDYDLLVWVESEGVGLRQPGKKAPNPVRVDFVGGSLGFRGKRSQHSRELVGKAVGIKRGQPLQVLDATAGLGRDAFVLASLGCEVVLLERSPVVSLLLEDALQRAKADPVTAEVVARMRLIAADAVNFMSSLTSQQCPQVVYLDPMFPERTKTASVKKEMRILQQLLGADRDTQQLFDAALKVATQRVVVKRPRIAPDISARKPQHVVAGKANRFDIYHVKALP